ncbi:flagellar hook-basal body complex protein FliE [Rhizorhabdus dicambivorans]|uniref:Flagellar hook-basal body complex protein FliE n=1 Tax=Rhizorhabdus dicambivorans TaxID=1850238 RepID=A0A2A4FUU4_9SPHN|nr:flagellar hook-basal body complex protein FliE [Rhizorhabdus dicambivorans]ATE64432.1 flagellar hook-basal body complex protein FliE [Rhizorhabdus dicambivorans]PCE41218.1 flagellar hook-basal body complex protein FliE [Rhizorhabdus dicambivorans]
MTTVNTSNLLAMRNAILQQNSALQKAAAAPAPNPLVGGIGQTANAVNAPDGGFTATLRGALGEVNNQQAKASAITESYERGETTDIAAVMLQRESASVGFQATLQVRNKLLSAYKDIMSMPV